jgi:nucleotide-binding universal stress UspA family protein
MISRILVPTDGSETAAKAVKYAATQGAGNCSKIP